MEVGSLVIYRYPDGQYDGLGIDYISGFGIIIKEVSTEIGNLTFEVFWFDKNPKTIVCKEKELILFDEKAAKI